MQFQNVSLKCVSIKKVSQRVEIFDFWLKILKIEKLDGRKSFFENKTAIELKSYLLERGNRFLEQLHVLQQFFEINSVTQRALRGVTQLDYKININSFQMNFFVDIEYPQPSASLPSSPQLTLPHDYQIAPSIPKICRRNLKTSNTDPGFHWTPIEQKRYVHFLLEHCADFALPLAEKRKKKLHVIMSKYIKMRDPSQCRSHHQKMMTKFKSIQAIIQNHQHFLCHSKAESSQQIEPKHQEKLSKEVELQREEDRQEVVCLDHIFQLENPSRVDHAEEENFFNEEYFFIEPHSPDLLSSLAAE